MNSSSEKKRPDRPGFIFVGDHPAIDFANTLSISHGRWVDHFRAWPDVIDWLSLSGVSTDPALRIPASRSAAAVKSVVELRQAWKTELDKLVAGGKVGDEFIQQLNQFLAEDVFHETLQRSGKSGFHLGRSAAQFSGEKLALATLSRQIAHFLAEAYFGYLHRCANTTSCALYFYDTTKNHRRQWCSTAACGNRHKVAEFRKRQVESMPKNGPPAHLDMSKKHKSQAHDGTAPLEMVQFGPRATRNSIALATGRVG
jgi:predicted RNA-binding Zn ribbon-like protein